MQSAVLPYALAGDDVIASAETGTGKTAAFVLPILQRFMTARRGRHARPGTRALILAPTRELAVQIEDAIQGLLYHTRDHERRGLRRRPDGAAGPRAPGRRATSSSRRRAG